jgi:predicted DNA-binding protein
MTSKKQQKKRKERRIQLDIDPELKKTLADLSAELGIPQSQIVSLFIEYGLEGLRSGDIDLEKYTKPARSPIWRHVIDLDKFRKDQKKKK